MNKKKKSNPKYVGTVYAVLYVIDESGRVRFKCFSTYSGAHFFAKHIRDTYKSKFYNVSARMTKAKVIL